MSDQPNLVPRTVKKLGWIRDLPDHRDQFFAAPQPSGASLPLKVDLSPLCPPIYDQGELGSCTANAIGAAFQFGQQKQGQKSFVPSRLFIYYNERVLEGTVNEDAGAMIRDGVKSLAKLGVCPETDWPYDITKFADKPPAGCYKEALEYQITQYMRLLQNLNEMKARLASGYPFVFGFSVYESFMTTQVAKTGIVPMPGPTESQVGGHAVLAVGYDDAQRVFIVRNSWGTGWGMKGYFTMPYEYLISPNLAADFWVIKTIEPKK